MKVNRLLLLAIFVMSGTLLSAQGFTVQPTQHDLSLEPGQSANLEITVKNTTTARQSYTVSVGDWTMDETGLPQYFPKSNTPYSCANWVTLTETLIDLAPNESKRVPITFIVPAGERGSKWAAVLVEPASEQLKPELVDNAIVTGAQATLRIGVPIFQSPSSNNEFKAIINNLKETEAKVFTTTVHNQGGKVIRGSVYTTLSNVQTGEEVQLKPFEVLVLPGLKRDVQFRLPTTVPKGSYMLTCILDYSDDADYEGTQMEVTVN